MSTIRQRPIDIGYLRTFERLARLLSYRAVADELALTQSAVSRQIQALEDDIGAQLFTRTTRQVQLTESGMLLLNAVAASLPRIDAVVQQLRHKQLRPTVYVTTFASFASLWLIPRLGAFQQQYPQVDIRVDASDMAMNLEAEGMDIALRDAPTRSVPAHASKLFQEYATLVAAPTYAAAQALHVPEDLARCTLIQVLDRAPKHITWLHWLEHAKHSQIAPLRWLSFDYGHQAVQAALAGQGVALVRWSLAQDYLKSGVLQELWPALRMPSPNAYWLLRNTHTAEAPHVRLFADWLLEQAAQTRAALGENELYSNNHPT